MSAENPQFHDPRKVLRGAAAGTVLSIAALTAGIYGWVKQEQHPVDERCDQLSSQAYNLERELFESGTLGSDGGLIFRYLEVRDPTDSRVKEWGQLKNEKDKACAVARELSNNPVNTLSRMGAIGGGVFALFGISVMRHQRNRIREQNQRTSQSAT